MASQASLSVSHLDNTRLASEEEEKGNLDKAITYYEAAIKDGTPDEIPYTRLMILYRKQKKFKDELRIINKGIKVFSDFYQKSSAKKGKGKKLIDLSEAFMKSSGLKDRKGNLVYQLEPIGNWMKRREVVERKAQGSGNKAQGKSKSKITNHNKNRDPKKP